MITGSQKYIKRGDGFVEAADVTHYKYLLSTREANQKIAHLEDKLTKILTLLEEKNVTINL